MAQAPRKPIKKRRPPQKRSPLKRANKKIINKPIKKPTTPLRIWFGFSHRLEIKLAPARLTKKQRQIIERRQKYLTFALIAAGVIGTVYFSVLFMAPIPQPPALAAPTQATSTVPEQDKEVKSKIITEPNQIKIPAINVNAPLTSVGINPDNTLEVPTVYDKAGWYKLGPKPGEAGAAVIVGHVNSKSGPAVFWNLSTVKMGDVVEVVGTNGDTAKFIITAVKQYPQNQFPTQEVYGTTNNPSLRLITCGGTYNRLTRRYSHNTVVFADLVN